MARNCRQQEQYGIRILLAFAILWTTVVISPAVQASSRQVIVFVPSFARPQALQEQLSPFFKSRGFDVQVLGRLMDVKRALNSDLVPDAIIAMPATIQTTFKVLDGVVVARAQLSGSTTEPLILVALDHPMSPGELMKKVVGMVSYVGRNDSYGLMEKWLGIGGLVKIRRVSKYENLTRMLQFGAASAVLVRQSMLTRLRSRTRLSLVATKLPKSAAMELPVTIGLSKAGRALGKEMPKMDPKLAAALGVDGWQLP